MAQDLEKKLLHLRNDRDASFFDLCSIENADEKDLKLIFELAREFRNTKTEKLSLGRGCSMINAFFENSTRTLASFDLSGKHLGMDTSNVGNTSSVKKGESFIDTVETLAAYNIKVIVIRSRESGIPEMVRRHVAASVINAGDGWHEHPTQALLEAITMLDYVKQENLEGKIVTIVGDIRHSRVFGSQVRILKRLGANIRVAAPKTLVPEEVENFGITLFNNVEEALSGADIVSTLRVQEERGAKGYIPSLREYSKTFGISERRFKLAKPDAILMHPGPVIRDIDVHSALVSRHPRSQILRQVENGMAVRKAVLWLLAKRFDGKIKKYELL